MMSKAKLIAALMALEDVDDNADVVVDIGEGEREQLMQLTDVVVSDGIKVQLFCDYDNDPADTKTIIMRNPPRDILRNPEDDGDEW